MRNSGHITPADRMAKLIAAARADDDAASRAKGDAVAESAPAEGSAPAAIPGGAEPTLRRAARSFPASGPFADSEPEPSTGAEPESEPAAPTRTGGWVPQLAPDAAEPTRSRAPAWLASWLPKSPRLGIAMGAGIVVAAIMVVAGGIFAIRFAVAAPAVHPVAASTPGSAESSAPGDDPDATGGASPAAASPALGDVPATSAPEAGDAAARVTVQVVGAVRKPGVVRLEAGARVIDAVKAAGGAGSRADTAAVNMARPVVDGEQIRLPHIGEDPSPAPSQAPVSPGNAAPGDGAPDAANPATPAVNLNTAGDTELETLPNVGPVTAQKIIDWRTANNGFSTVEDLLDVPGIGPKTFGQLKDLVTV